jgi:NlpC/P60 family putative phage cell wall peptidase
VTEEAERALVVACARSWAGTPFRDGAAIKGVGVDCAQLVRAVAIEAGIAEVEPTGGYSSQWMLHKDDDRLVAFIRRYAREIAPEAAKVGDLVVYRVGRAFSHVAILTGGGRIVHAHKMTRAVMECGIDDMDLKGRERRFFSPWA